MSYFLTVFLSVFITIALIPILKSFAGRMNAVDQPSPRKVHSRPMPKVGGLAMAFGMLVSVAVWARVDPFLASVMAGAIIIVIFGFVDDIYNLGYKSKFLGQVIAGLIVICWGGVRITTIGDFLLFDGSIPVWVSIPLTLLAITGVTNAVNLSDGLDGLAGGITLITLLLISCLAFRAGDHVTVMLVLAMAGGIFGFLRYNTYPATVFMGDAGSQLIGFISITASIRITQPSSMYSPILPLVILGLPVLDTLTVFVSRIMKGNSPFKADKNHFHHRLMNLGFYHSEAVVLIYIIHSILVFSAYFFKFHSDFFLFMTYFICSGLMISLLIYAERTNRRFTRSDRVDRLIKNTYQAVLGDHFIIKVSGKIIEFGTPFLLFSLVLLMNDLPGYVSGISLVFAAVLLFISIFRKKLTKEAIRFSLFLTIPFVVFFNNSFMVQISETNYSKIYHLLFGGLSFFVILTLKYTRRQSGFRTTPLDFLILFIALAVPIFSKEYLASRDMGLMAIKIITLFFAYEVLLGEARGKYRGILTTTIVILIFTGIRSFIPI